MGPDVTGQQDVKINLECMADLPPTNSTLR